MTRQKVIGLTFTKTKSKFYIKDFKNKKSTVFGWLKSNKCECKNTNGKEPLPTVVPQQI